MERKDSQLGFNEIKDVTDYIDQRINDYQQGHPISVGESLLVIGSILIILFQLVSYIRLLKSPLYNVISYVDFNKLNKKKNILKTLDELRGATNADRITVGLFHNGTSIGSIHFTVMSVFYQSCKTGVERVRYSNIPIENIEEELEKIHNSTDIFTKYSRDDENINMECARYLDSLNINTVYSKLLIFNKKPRGIIEFQYFSKPKEDISNDKDIEVIFNRLASQIKKVIR